LDKSLDIHGFSINNLLRKFFISGGADMTEIILRTNAIPVYGFLSNIMSMNPPEQWTAEPKILDCGAGGPLPPLALFVRQGFEAYGIDISEEQLERSRKFCGEYGIKVDFRKADMRQIPFEANTFDYVYEHFSMCHLNHADTAKSVSEMRRVLKPGGIAFLGVMSTDCWPHAQFGKEQAPGVLVGAEGGLHGVTHSLWTDSECDQLVAGWQVVDREKMISYLVDMALEVSQEDWMDLHVEAPNGESVEAWKAAYPNRLNYYRYVHMYFFLKKPLAV
jgi:ubiquinone/menaquinone biosynthesis C-methylase UbiE